MTPAQLNVLLNVHAYVNSDDGGTPKPKPSENPAADLAALAAL